MTCNVELLKYNSRFLKRASPDDIEFERLQLEAEHDCKLKPFRIVHDSMSGTPMTLVEWEIVE